MNELPFWAIFPKKVRTGDAVAVKGQLKANVRVFSVNFVMADRAEGSPPFIAYHFKTTFGEDDEGIVVQTWKNVVWQEEWRGPNDWLLDKTAPFKLIFRFHHDSIRVFSDHTDQAPLYEFEHQVPPSRIHSIELWGDVEYVEELSFRFEK